MRAGAGQGIGRAVAHGLGEAGASVAIVDIAGDKADATAEELRAKGIRSIAIQADVSSKKDCTRCAWRLQYMLKVLSVDHEVGQGLSPASQSDLHLKVLTSSYLLCSKSQMPKSSYAF